MVKIILVSKNGELEETNYKKEDTSKLYKSAGFKDNTEFKCYVKWKVEYNNKMYSYLVYGNKNGNAGCENKYEFPPPIDNLLLFNNCVIIKRKNGQLYDINLEEWLFVYENLYGGFEDIGEEEEESEEDYDGPLTKTGYAKDGFIVDDDDDEEEDYEYIDDDDDDIEIEDIEDKEEEEEEESVTRTYNTRSRKKKDVSENEET
tara:strand:+ start:1389 stop:1997 length:609 start_codon:yes stop_codon:yes gene_type:complete